jgi:hypothetical protein
MGMVYAYKKGDLDLKDLSPSLAKKVKEIADGKKRKTGDKRKKTDGISLKDAKAFASTKHKGLPEKVEESSTSDPKGFIEFIMDYSMFTREELEKMSEEELENLYYEVCDFLSPHEINPRAHLEEWKNEKVITKFENFLNEGKALDFFDKYEVTAGGPSGVVEYGFIDVHIDEIDDDVQFEIEQYGNGDIKVQLRDWLDDDDLETVKNVLKEYGVKVDDDTLEIENDDFIGAILKEYEKQSYS